MVGGVEYTVLLVGVDSRVSALVLRQCGLLFFGCHLYKESNVKLLGKPAIEAILEVFH
jgi:hypothetical protein